MLNLSAAGILEKNKLTSAGVWLILLKLTLSDASIIRLARNTEDITWDGQTWQKFPMEIDDVTREGQGEQSVLTIRVSNVTRTLMPYLEQYKGMVGNTVNLYIVHSENLANTTPEVDESFKVVSSSADAMWVTFELSASNLLNRQFPDDRYLKNWCRFKFNYPAGTSVLCGYSGSTYFTCNKTLADCRLRGNSARFGGFPGIPEGGIYVST